MAKKNFINRTYIEGYLYEHKLELKVTSQKSKTPGVNYIRGSIDIATNEDCTNIVSINYTYVTPTKSSGGANPTYNTLLNIIDGNFGTYMKDGKDKAVKVKVSSAIGVNDFYTDRTGTTELVSAKRNEGGFIHVIDKFETEDEKKRATFDVDMLITNVIHVDANPDAQKEEKAIIKGLVFDFKGAILPVEFSAINPGAINYYESLGVSNSNPVFTRLWGSQVSEVITKLITQESAFGEDSVREVKNSRKDFVITGSAKEPYLWDDESTITATELTQKIAERETYLATIKKNNEEYKANKNAAPFDIGNQAATATIPNFNF